MAADAVVDPDAPESGVWKWVKIGFFVVVAVGLIAIGTSTAGANGGLKLANALIAIVGGVLGAMVLFWLLNKLVEMLPPKWEERQIGRASCRERV